MTCRGINYGLSEHRVQHLLCRVGVRSSVGAAGVARKVKMCDGESEVRDLLVRSLGGGNTGRLITAKSKLGGGDADEYVAYARFLEEGLCGYATQGFGGKETPLLPPSVNGRFTSCSPEHTLCRIGGDGHKCGAGGSGVAAWGVGKRGQLGNGKREDESAPKMLMGGIGYGIRIVQVSAGGGLVRVAHSLLLTSTGRVLSFGTAQYGQLGHGYSAGKQLSDELRPRYIDALSGVRCTCVSAGELHSAAVTTDGDVYTWGDGFCGQLGLGDKRPQLLPQQITEGGLEDECVSVVSCGNRHTLCVTEDGEVFSFGLGHFGALGRSYTPFEYDADAAIGELGDDVGMPAGVAMAPVASDNTPTETQLSDPGGISDETRAHLDLIANLTLDDSSDQCIPKVVDSLEGIHIINVSSGHRHSLFLDSEGGLYSCGSGASGELGHGDFLRQAYPMKIVEFSNSDLNILQMSAGVDISMAVTSTGDVYAWGKADGGRIGLGISANKVSIPRRVIISGKVGEDNLKAMDVECGYVHSVVVGIDGSVHICGGVGTDGNEDGQRIMNGGDELTAGRPLQLEDFNIWHRIPEPKVKRPTERWKKYGKYEVKGRAKMKADAEKWGN
eukprot:CAMPEP_0183298936 /NCGR_PEP_ID=MMETSP0160_2-20130417/5802_1 /TAXON_ID=2839 ORGANISM="Odontella Sinensis, Strain Grunow 1884" /NCGR_SAMPLE_ID=MMETSP0160_2 /ASSEMBLY_ACC=CAM_ASM_000250 /LENGTH=612 /DNA_ID=CAMNT_0025461067 /DNA_START=105 /DNA_END=1943 /DNA_ORIENTATION=+